MDIFNKKKLSKLEEANEILRQDNKTLLNQIDELKQVIQDKGYVFPDVKHLIFRNDSNWLVQSHFNSVINAMNTQNIEIIKNSISNDGFDIYYRLPPNLSSADFTFACDLRGGWDGISTYETKFKFYKKDN